MMPDEFPSASAAPPEPAEDDVRVLPLSRLLGRPLIDRGGESLGRSEERRVGKECVP